MDIMEHKIQLEPKDIQRIRRVNLIVKQAQDEWNSLMKFVLIDYLDDDIKNKKISITSLNFYTGELKLNVNGGAPNGSS